MGVLVEEIHKFYILALITQEAEANAKMYRESTEEGRKALLEKNSPEDRKVLERTFRAEKSHYKMYEKKGLSDTSLEDELGGFGSKNLLNHPIAGSKDIVDIFLGENIVADFNALDLVGLGKQSKNKKINEWLASQKNVLRLNVKGMQVECNKKGIFKATITLSRTTKGQKEEKYDLEMSCNDMNFKLDNILDYFVVWFRLRGDDDLWRHKVVAFSPKIFRIDDYTKFKQLDKRNGDGKQKQYKYENHTKNTHMTINPGASFQFNCICNDLDEFLKEFNSLGMAEVIYDSWKE